MVAPCVFGVVAVIVVMLVGAGWGGGSVTAAGVSRGGGVAGWLGGRVAVFTGGREAGSY